MRVKALPQTDDVRALGGVYFPFRGMYVQRNILSEEGVICAADKKLSQAAVPGFQRGVAPLIKNVQCIDNVITTCYNISERSVCIMPQTTVSVRMDDNLKKEFDSVCNDLGLSMTTAVTMLAKKMTREKRLPFEVSIDPFYSDKNMARLRKSVAQMEKSGGTVHEVDLDD